MGPRLALGRTPVRPNGPTINHKRKLAMIVSSQDHWWDMCISNWENMLNIFEKVGAPMGRSEEDHWWSDRPGQPDTHHEKCLVQTLEDLKAARNGPVLHAIMHRAWYQAPERGTYKWDGWIVFCDLISEDWVFDKRFNPVAVHVERHPSEGEAPDDVIFPQAHRPPS